MNRNLLILGCSQTKRETPGLLPAIDRYDGSSYRVLRKYLREHEWPEELSVAILSAKYGLVGGFTSIEYYDERMTQTRALEWAPKCKLTLDNWMTNHNNIYMSLGKDYLPAVLPAINSNNYKRYQVFEGPIGMKLSQIRQLLQNTDSPVRHNPVVPETGTGKMSYFLPDWDDLLDEEYNFESDTFSGTIHKDRHDKHCCVLMKPKRMCDGILVSLAQHIVSKGPLRRILGTEASSLAPINLRNRFGLDIGQSLFGDCGAFSYVNNNEPAITVEQAVALYDLHGFDFGASVDHIPVPSIINNGHKIELSDDQRKERIEITKKNAERLLTLRNDRHASFIPVGVVQALSPGEYAKTVRLYHEYGYRHIAIGGLVPLHDKLIEEIVVKVMTTAEKLKPRPWIHLFGIFRPKLQALFRQFKVNSFDSATYFRKAWLRSDQNYLAPNGNWYAALRVPMTKDGRTRKKLEESGIDIDVLEVQEESVLQLLCRYDKDEVGINEVLDAVIEYDECLTRSSDANSMRTKYRRTLLDKPWRSCDCPFCKQLGIHMLIFRGSNRNKRRGAHNTLMLYGCLGE